MEFQIQSQHRRYSGLARRIGPGGLVSGLLLGLLMASGIRAETPAPRAVPAFREITAAAGLDRLTITFGAVFADIDNDGDDDLLVSRHARGPAIYLNQGELQFTEATKLLPRSTGDRHGMTVADLDNDGDRDIVIANGGGDGEGKGGWPKVFRNLLVERGALSFEDISKSCGLREASEYRARSYLPVASSDGSRVDLYLTNKPRTDFPNRYYSNLSADKILFAGDDSSAIGRTFNSTGMDLFVDLDRDQDQDLLIIDERMIRIFKRGPEGFSDCGSLSGVKGVQSIAAGDLDNDGYPDLYVGTGTSQVRGDLVAAGPRRLNFLLVGGRQDTLDRISFYEDGEQKVKVRLRLKPGILADDPSNIFLGSGLVNPPSRDFDIAREEAVGEPVIDRPGIYIWFDQAAEKWNLLASYDAPRQERGVIYTQGLVAVTTFGIERRRPTATADRFFINRGGQLVAWAEAPQVTHSAVTAACKIVDLDNDGLADILGIRRQQEDKFNGKPFVVMNRGQGRFEVFDDPAQAPPEDALYHADQLVTADIDNDGLVDAFYCNGWGLRPANTGPYRLLLNTTATANRAVSIELEGRQSNRDAIAAQVELWAGTGEQAILLGYRELGSSYNRSQSSRQLHFGIGSHQGPLRAKVWWPAGGQSEHQLTPGRHSIQER